jgi:glycosyltransferase involved in cell wall biosynthesis
MTVHGTDRGDALAPVRQAVWQAGVKAEHSQVTDSLQKHAPLSGKRVLIVLGSFELGGAERQGLHLARYLLSQECDVRVWSTGGEGDRVPAVCAELGIPCAYHRFRWPCRKRSMLRDYWRFWLALMQERPDVILSYTAPPNFGCGLFWRWSSAQVFVWGQRNIETLSQGWVSRYAYRHASAIVCNAEHERRHLFEQMGPSRGPCRVIHNGVDLAAPVKSRRQWRDHLGISDEAVVVTMLANFRPVKDHATLLAAWARLQGVVTPDAPTPQLVLAGAEQASYPSVRKLADALGVLGKSVHMHGQVADVSGLLAASDVGVLSSHAEGLPNAVLEYMAAGLPVVATDLAGVREALGVDRAHPLPGVNDMDQWVDALVPLITDASLRQRLGARNRQRAEASFSLNVMCRQTVEFLGSLL